jgi:hypothetical protein
VQIDEQAAARFLSDLVKKLLRDQLEPVAQALVTKAFDYLRSFTDRVLTAACTSLGTVPFAGGALVLGAQQAYSFAMEQLQSLIVQKGMDLLFDKVVEKVLKKTVGKLARPLVKQVNDFLKKSKVGKLMSKALSVVEKIPAARQKLEGMFQKHVAKAPRASAETRAELRKWVAEKVQADADYETALAAAGFSEDAPPSEDFGEAPPPPEEPPPEEPPPEEPPPEEPQ